MASQQPQERFELLEQLGKGSYGSVFKARDRQNSQVYAIKVMAFVEEVSVRSSSALGVSFTMSQATPFM